MYNEHKNFLDIIYLVFIPLKGESVTPTSVSVPSDIVMK